MEEKEIRKERDSRLVQLVIEQSSNYRNYRAASNMAKSLQHQVENGGIANFGEDELFHLEVMANNSPELYGLFNQYKASGEHWEVKDCIGKVSRRFVNGMNSARFSE